MKSIVNYVTGQQQKTAGWSILQSRVIKDKWFLNHPEFFDSRSEILKNQYQVLYGPIDITVKVSDDRTKISYTFEPTCDLLSTLELLIHETDKIAKIETECSGKCIDVLKGELHIQYAQAFYNQSTTSMNSKRVVPLVLSPFYSTNMIPPMHNIRLILTLEEPLREFLPTLYGSKYYLSSKDQKPLLITQSFVTLQNQYLGHFNINKGTNRIKLLFHDQIALMYLWGLDKTKITNIKLLLNDIIYFDGPIEILEHTKLHWINVEPIVISFSEDGFEKEPKSSINFSVIDNPVLVIETEEEKSLIEIVGLGLLPYTMTHNSLDFKTHA